MDDLIRRQDAIDAIDVLKRNYPSSCFEDLCKAVDIAIKVLSAQPEPRWISVTERLPEKNGEYLVTKIDRITHDGLIDIAHYANFIHLNNGFYKADEVIAWMPLPDPYRKETEDGTTN